MKNEGFTGISGLMEKYKQPIKEVKTTTWQFEALEAITKLKDGNKFKASIFKCFKTNPARAKNALNDSIELKKPYSLYFLKVFNAITK